LDIAHTNLCGSSRAKSLQGDIYLIFLIDDYSRMIWVIFLREKSKALENFKILKATVETKTRLKLKCLRFDKGGEFTSSEFNEFCEENGVKR
jgi:transposase InsO family protein